MKLLRTAIVSLALGFALARIGWAQPIVLEKFVATPAYLEAKALGERIHDRPIAVEKFLALGRANPRTTLGAVCLFEAAYYLEDSALARPIYEEIKRDYASTVFGLHAQSVIFGMDFGDKPDAERYQARERMLASLGLPITSQVVNRPTQSVRQLKGLEANYSEEVCDLYWSQAAILVALGRYDEAIALAKLGFEVWPTRSAGHSLAHEVKRAYIAKYNLQLPLTPSPARPITLRVDLDENSRRCGRPLLRGQAYIGDFNSRKIDWSYCVVTLDGVDIRPQLNFVYQYPKKLKPGKVFELIKFSYQPARPLTPGRHTLYFKLMTGHKLDGPVTELTRNFFVDRSLRDDREENEDEQDRQRRQERDD
jgi:tetratricopeptide (TPR) repeat protein